MKDQILSKVLVLAVVVLLSTAHTGFCEGMKGSSSAEHSGKGLWQDEENGLGLNPEQKAQMKALRESFRAKQQALREQIKAKHEALRQVLDSSTPNRAQAESILKEINNLQAQMGSNRIDEIFMIRGILTPEQFQKLREFREKHRGKFEGKMKDGRAKGRFHSGEKAGPGPEGE